jgi:hypothetical protein
MNFNKHPLKKKTKNSFSVLDFFLVIFSFFVIQQYEKENINKKKTTIENFLLLKLIF